MNIRARLTLLFVLLVASILLLFSISIYYSFNQFRENEFFERLEEKALTAARLLEDAGNVREGNLPILVKEHITVYSTDRHIIFNSSQRTFPLTNNWFNQLTLGKKLRIRRDDTEAIGLLYTNKAHKPLIVVASAVDRYGFSKLARLRQILLFGWLVSLIIVGIAGWLFASDVIRPITEIIDQVNTISAFNIHNRLRVGRQRDELAQLARTFNSMLSRLEEAFVTQKSFVSHASHELRTPLTVMQGQIDVTLMQARSTPEYIETLENVMDDVRQMISLVNGLLELARASGDASTLNFSHVRIDELLWQARSAVLSDNAAYQVTIHFENFPDQEDELTLYADEYLLRTAFQNLMENGCKYSVDGGVSVVVAFSAKTVQLTVSDRGSGIPAKDIPHVFEPFFRAENALGTKGHGIGLALTHRIVMIHQGTIQLQSQESVGTSIEITLPIQKSDVPQLPTNEKV